MNLFYLLVPCINYFLNSLFVLFVENIGKCKVVAPLSTSLKKGVNVYIDAPLEKETRIANHVHVLQKHQEAMQYLTTHSLDYLLDPNPGNQLSIYPKEVWAFYYTHIEIPAKERKSMINDPKSYFVIIEQNVLQFSTIDLCELIGFPQDFDPK